ncbi:MAG TPA: alpha/beta fold hydrolase, partial [Solirubrobacteraceae bacterium]|nr:alpha/beta fold hydrolase [Solirubrobacteraceae bacterium]
ATAAPARVGTTTAAARAAVAVCAAACALAAALALPRPAHAATGQVTFAPCKESTELACAHLAVPLDPGGATPGTITLAIRRRRAPVGEARSAVIALGGGPGQAAIPFTESFIELLGPILDTRDLIVFDQRGTGYSHPLSCHGFEAPGAYRAYGKLLASCAEQIGPERAFYTTLDSVADIEALRRALGYEKLVLYGTSYGTKVAEEYAQRYPQNVEALILDSVVPPAGPDPLDRSTFAAIPRVLRQLCAQRLCAHITHNPVGDLARLVKRMGTHPPGGAVIGHYVGSHGHRRPIPISSDELADVLLAGDFNPILRAELPAAVHAADEHDYAPLARLLVHTAGGEHEEGEGIDVPLYLTTTCEEVDFPWRRTAGPRERLAQARAAIDALPASAFAPFTAANVLNFDELGVCAYWPFATPAPPAVASTLPNVPTLILSGADDLRTPTANAREVAAQIPDAHMLVVPYTGHAVLEDEPGNCARKALRAMFAGGVGVHPIKPCPTAPPPALLRPTPLAPARLADVAPARGYHGRAGRTLHAVRLTIADAARQLALRLLEAGPGASGMLGGGTLDSGGLRSGWASLGGSGLRFHDYSYIPGVALSGAIQSEHAMLYIAGNAAAGGVLRLGAHHLLVGELEGEHVTVRASATGGAGIQASVLPARPRPAGPQRHVLPARRRSTSLRLHARPPRADAVGVPSAAAQPDAIVGADAQASEDLGSRGGADGAAARELAR